jgi:hypothetical protein
MELKKIDTSIQELQDAIISNNDLEGFYGDGESIPDIPEIPLKHSFADQLYIRQMNLSKGDAVIGAIHNHKHVWFLLIGKVSINNNGEIVDHIAPCYVISEAGSKRVIYAHEDSIFVNVHKNPSNSENIKELEKELVSMNMEEFNKKNN